MISNTNYFKLKYKNTFNDVNNKFTYFQAADYSSSATMIPRQHPTGIGGLNTSIQPGPGSSSGKSDMSSSSMTPSSVLSGDSLSSSVSSTGVSATMSSGSSSGRIINLSSSKMSVTSSSINNSSSGKHYITL